MALATHKPHVIEAGNGTRLLAGLSWTPRPTRRLPSLLQSVPELLTATRMAQVEAMELVGSASLLLAMASSPQMAAREPNGLWLFVAPLDGSLEGRWWIGGVEFTDAGTPDNGMEPALFGETIFDTFDPLVERLRQLHETQQVQGVAVGEHTLSGGKAKLTNRIKAAAIPGLSEHVHQLTELATDCDTFKPAPHISTTMLVGVAIAVASLGLNLFLGNVTPEPPPVRQVQYRDVVIQQGAFGQNCRQHLTAWWPRAIGWTLMERGCGLISTLPEDLADAIPARTQTPPDQQAPPDQQTNGFVSWVRLLRDTKANGSLARASGASVVNNWPHGSDTQQDRILLWRFDTLPTRDISHTAMASPQRDGKPGGPAIDHLWANRGDSVDRSPDGRIAIKTAAALTDIIRRLNQLQDHEPIYLTVQWPTLARLELRPVQTSRVMIDTDTHEEEG